MPKGYLRERFESTPGFEGAEPTLSTKTLDSPATSIENAPEPSPLERDDELRGVDEPLVVFPDEYDPTWGYSSRAYPDLLAFRLTQILGQPTTTAGDGVIEDPDENAIPEGAFRHVWEAPFGPPGPNTLTVDQILGYADESTFIHVTGSGAEELTLGSDEAGGVKVGAKGKSLFWEPISDPEITPTPESLAIQPFMRRGLKVLTFQGTVQDLENFGVTITNPLEYGRSMGVDSGFPDLAEKGEGPVLVMLEVPKRHVRKADLEALLEAERFEVVARWLSRSLIGETEYPYALWLEGDGAQYTGGGPASLENKRRLGASYQAKLTSDGTGASSKFTLVNATESYE